MEDPPEELNIRTAAEEFIFFSSTDLYHWTYSGILYEAEPGEGRMFECPDAFCLDDVWF